MVLALALVCVFVMLPESALCQESPPLRIVLPNEPGVLDPHLDPTWVGGAILANVYDDLLSIDAEGRMHPVLATNWEQVGERVWLFRIRENVVFHDGRPLTANDVASSIDRVRHHPKSQAKVRFATVAKTESIDPLTVRITLAGPDPAFLKKLDSLSIVQADTPETIANPIGTGAYRVVAFNPGRSVQLEAFDGYWGAKPAETRVEFYFDEDHDRAIRRLMEGYVDLVANLTPESLPLVEANEDLWVDSAVGSYVHMLGLNGSSVPFEDDILREAVEQALDRHGLARQIFLDHARPAAQLVSETNHGYAPDLKPIKRNLPLATALVKAAKASDPIEFTLEFRLGHERFAEAVKRQLEPAGFVVTLQPRTYDELIQNFLAGKHQASLISLRVGARDVGLTFDQVIHSGSPLGGATKATDPSIDRMIVACRSLTDPEERLQLLHRVAHRIAERRILLPMVWAMDLYGVRREIDWKPDKGGTIDLRTISRRSE